MDRGQRRARTETVGKARRDRHLKIVHPTGVVDCACDRSTWKFAKDKGLGCRCQRRNRSAGPKVPGSLCHGGGYDYHPCVRERIEGKRLTAAWLAELAGAEPDDVEL